ncbi:MAG: nucleotidyltransferase domain-containing protein [bacterium]|nr:nucleotidyltransferase domain-containing protein [bacterium]
MITKERIEKGESLGIKPTIESIIGILKEKFGTRLISIVLFGSLVNGRSHRFSDIDLLVVAEGLPDNWRDRDKIVLDIDFNCGRHVELVLVSPEDLLFSVENIAPLMLEIYDNNQVLYDRGQFFSSLMKEFVVNLRLRQAKKIREGVWEVHELVEA